LHSAIPFPASAENLQVPASAENLQEDFSSRLNKGPSTIVSRQPPASAGYESHSSLDSPSPMSPSSSSTCQDPQQIASGHLLVAASPGVISPQASAVVTAFIARHTFCGLHRPAAALV
jgi:hypothetical protein